MTDRSAPADQTETGTTEEVPASMRGATFSPPSDDWIEGPDSGGLRIPPLSAEEQAAAVSTNDVQARAEEASLSNYATAEQLADRARQAEADRDQHFKDAFERIAIAALYIGSVIIAILAGVWTLHLVLPVERRWLSVEDLTHVQTLLTAGVLVGAVGGHFKKRMGDGPR